MASKADWLDAGLAILAERGAPAVTIERLTERLGLTKGSFYHHFKGIAGFQTALLAHFEAEHTTRFIDAVEREPSAPAMAKLERLLDVVLPKRGGPELEIAMRAWAQQRTDVRDLQERVDRTRIGYLRSLLLELSGDDAEADRLGQLLYLVVVGAGHVIPPVPPERLRHLCQSVLRLASAGPKETT